MGAGKKESALSAYGRSTTRNLGKTQLGGVIFGATKNTMNECLSKQLFGLPSQHLLYVEKIGPGLPLFLFNYTDRKLHGIFEAASPGKLNIDPYAWTVDGSKRTPFPAQVQIVVRLQCQALTENQFKPIIVDNYYAPNHFWFELDHAQTNRLIAVLSSQVVTAPPLTTRWKPLLQFIPKSDKKDENAPVYYMPVEAGSAHVVKSSPSTEKDANGSSKQPLDKIGEDEKELIYLKLQELALSHKLVDPRKNDCAVTNEAAMEAGASSGEAAVDKEKKEDIPAKSNGSPMVSNGSPMPAQLLAKFEEFEKEQNRKNGSWERKIVSLERKVVYLEQKNDYLEHNMVEAVAQIKNLKDHCAFLESMLCPEDFGNRKEREWGNEIDNHSDSSFERESAGDKYEDVSPEGSGIYLEPDDSILLVGGYNGALWLPSLDCYSPSKNTVKSLKPMASERYYAPTSIFRGEVYVYGGGTNGLWYDSVESYNPLENQWTTRPPLTKKRGSLAGATVKDKIYAVGGGVDDEFYSLVEMFDINVGEWIPTQSMLQKRFSLAAAELNGVLYAVGGYDGDNYLKTVERFDPREHYWKKIESMNEPRGCPSLVVLNEKLYALGGFDGYNMSRTVEVYDPRRGSWTMGEPMYDPRGFSAAAVAKDSIYVFGGLKNGEMLNDSVESYKEGLGWEIIDVNTARRRCFFSAVAL